MSDRPHQRVYTPSELNHEARIHLEAGFGLVRVCGEISNLSRPASGHLYFSLKDAKAQLRCALFRNRALLLNQRLENGAQVEATARVSLYEPRGDYQLIVESVAAAGDGLLQQRYEELKQRLQAEGLFAAERKQPLPAQPRVIGLITSPSGAAVRDVLQVLRRRYPLARVRIYPAAVQGADAPGELRQALDRAIADDIADTLIIGRGGGSLEDLWAFNDEDLVRAVAACPLPIIAAVGHEVDFSLCDFAADVRAPTPSAAAELATPDSNTLRRQLEQARQQLRRELRRRLDHQSQRLDYASVRLRQRHPQQRLHQQAEQLSALRNTLLRISRHHLETRQWLLSPLQQRLQQQHPARRWRAAAERLQQMQRRLDDASRRQLRQQQQRFTAAARQLHLASPLSVLARGYSIACDPATDQVIAQYDDARAARQIRLIGHNFELQADVVDVARRDVAPAPGND
ncbi:MAG: exodeoxyribonuclease VII large subunit [Wenzhouxiangellaceae bacterium]